MITFSQFILLEGQLEKHFTSKGVPEEEAKDAIARWRELTPKQKEQVPNPQKYQEFESFLKDLVSAEKFTSKTAKEKQVKQSGIQGLKKGEDYVDLETGDPDIQAYVPLHYEASKLIASKDVGSCEGKWCTAYQKTSEHWDEYIDGAGGVLIYFVTPETKYAAYYGNEKDYELFNAEDKKLANSPIDDLVAELGKKFGELREYFPPSYGEIIEADDVDSFEERYKENPELFSKKGGNIMTTIIQGSADQCLDWVLKNVPLEGDALAAGMISIVSTDFYYMHKNQEDTYDSPAMKDRFMKLVDALPETVLVNDKNGISYEAFVEMAEAIAVNLYKTDFYFDVVLNDDKFYFKGSDFREGVIELWDDLLNGYADPDDKSTKRALKKLKKRKKEVEKKEKEKMAIWKSEFRTRLLGNID